MWLGDMTIAVTVDVKTTLYHDQFFVIDIFHFNSNVHVRCCSCCFDLLFYRNNYKRVKFIVHYCISKTVTPLALFFQIEFLCFCSSIRRQTCVARNTATAAQIMVLMTEATKG